MRLFWTPEARQDRQDIREYVAKEHPAAAIALDEMFAAKARMLLSHEAMGRPGRVGGTRELIVHRNYILVYAQVEGAIRILRLLHARRQWPTQA